MSLLCSAAGGPNGTIASASEDNTARLWHADGSCLQVIEHPGCVWDVAFTANGDLVTACSDYVARIWTRNSNQVADKDTIEVGCAYRKRCPDHDVASACSDLPRCLHSCTR